MNNETETEITPPFARVSYRNGMLLDATDFSDEQAYHRDRLAEALKWLHGSGTVAGLKVEAIRKDTSMPDGDKADEDMIVVHPGLALDRKGRLIEVPKFSKRGSNLRILRLDKWLASIAPTGSAVLKPLTSGSRRQLLADVFLRYLETPKGLRPAFPEDGADATDAAVTSRLNDGFELVMAPRSSDQAVLPRKPFQPPPATRQALLDAIYASYDPAEGPPEYPVAPMDDTPAGTPAKKLKEKSAVFLARVFIRLTDAPDADLLRHHDGDLTIEDKDRLVLPAAELLLGLTPLA
ncbi:MAG TPA: hypothetical protein VI454_08805 [Verrucomicrobiae bacterium]|jgi:hypothetical protein